MSDIGYQEKQATASDLRRMRMRKFRDAVHFRLRLLYGRTLYRPHMRILHRFNRHWFKHLRPWGGPEMKRCEWCGEREGVE